MIRCLTFGVDLTVRNVIRYTMLDDITGQVEKYLDWFFEWKYWKISIFAFFIGLIILIVRNR
ncbi:MAG: hypothetical protein KAS07_05825 [Candidatus Pacebacteria bacterium]|nr:hypothetical protein [Candidatus Paceibacterota bacterium]